MNLTVESMNCYQQAQKQGRKAHRESVHRGRYPYLQVLDEILEGSMIAGQVDLGIIDIPAECIVGTKTVGRTNAFASNYMPLLDEDSEFAMKWRRLCQAHLGDEGIRDPIRCYEYLGRFYVQEGNKRVSVLKYFGAANIPGYVIRLLPSYSTDEQVRRYYSFLDHYACSRLYQLTFTDPGSFAKLQVALGYERDHVWTQEERRRFLSGFHYFTQVFRRLGGDELAVTPADALLVWLKVYPFESTRTMSSEELLRSLQAVWSDVKVLGRAEPIAVSTESPEKEEKNLISRIFSGTPSGLKVAFIHELLPEDSNWVRGHEQGRLHLEKTMGGRVMTQSFAGVGSGDGALAAMETAIRNGAEVIFATTAPLIDACRKTAARYPNVKILNCSISMPYTGVRTYYSRIYEGKFISGAIAGAMCRSDRIGYIASYPIFGVPAGINAFALGAQLTNPRARVELKWACVPGDPLGELVERGVDMVSTLDIPMAGWEKGLWGTFQVQPEGSVQLLASPYWNWGTFYVRLINSILSGSWDDLNSSRNSGRAVNYWWGMASGVIGVQLEQALPEGVEVLVQILRRDIINGTIAPFHRRILDQSGQIRNDGGTYFTPEEILHMDWLCDNVEGTIPDYEALTEKGRAIVRLQGIYRDQIPPEKEGVLL